YKKQIDALIAEKDSLAKQLADKDNELQILKNNSIEYSAILNEKEELNAIREELNIIKKEIEKEKELNLQHEIDLSAREAELSENRKQLAKEFEELNSERAKRAVIIKAIDEKEKQLNSLEKYLKNESKALSNDRELFNMLVSKWLEKIEKLDNSIHSIQSSGEEILQEIKKNFQHPG
ncbi:MAG: hypothetical protein ACP5RS_00385, partial [Thermoplasmata archaeon]